MENNLSSQNSCEKLSNLMNPDDVSTILKRQKSMLAQLDKTNEMLLNCNNIAEKQQNILVSKFQDHTKLLIGMRKDLQSLHSRIRRLKSVLEEKCPKSSPINEDNPNSSEDQEDNILLSIN